ncbi:hypothetical protein QJS10_CPA05g00768 [Acorus calamus]|uniref:Uncharacterized protein n=1 Tax=Acorus calamus TaxID=4465 RepID=A0AAV9ESV3_ACOCL|nr:hypothetical protein QJS10_CPA05g00768 [Acorus calamus]
MWVAGRALQKTCDRSNVVKISQSFIPARHGVYGIQEAAHYLRGTSYVIRYIQTTYINTKYKPMKNEN